MNETDRKHFLQLVKDSLSEMDPGESDVLQHCVGAILKIAMSSNIGPLTLLLPGEEAFRRVGVDPGSDVPIAHKDKILGLMLDQIIMSPLPPPMPEGAASVELMSLSGAIIRFEREDGQFVLTDEFGRKATAGKPLVETPKITCRPADNVLMWDEWGWL